MYAFTRSDPRSEPLLGQPLLRISMTSPFVKSGGPYGREESAEEQAEGARQDLCIRLFRFRSRESLLPLRRPRKSRREGVAAADRRSTKVRSARGVIVFATNAHEIMEPRKYGSTRKRERERERERERKKYIARNTSDSAIGVPHTSRMAAAELLSAARARRGAPRFAG